jgi:uncharacterized membrane protein
MSEDFDRRAVIGGVITVAVAPLPLFGLVAPVVGGGIAAWLAADSEDDGPTVGAAAGAVAALIVDLVLGGTALLLAVTRPTSALLAVPLLLLVITAYTVALGAAGGFLGQALAGTGESTDRRPATDDAVERLREQYATSEMSEREFERRLETLLAEGDDHATDDPGDTREPTTTTEWSRR